MKQSMLSHIHFRMNLSMFPEKHFEVIFLNINFNLMQEYGKNWHLPLIELSYVQM